MRIIAGDRKGMRLVAPKSEGTRPTLGRVRESLFMILHDRLPGTRVLDLYAGAGGLVLEALSRGATSGVAVETARVAIVALRANVEKLNYKAQCGIAESDVLRWLGRAGRSSGPYDVIFLDPPYGKKLAHQTLAILGEEASEWLTPDGVVVAQVGKRDPLEPAYGDLVGDVSRTYGETRIDFYSRISQT